MDTFSEMLDPQKYEQQNCKMKCKQRHEASHQGVPAACVYLYETSIYYADLCVYNLNILYIWGSVNDGKSRTQI